MVGILQTSRVNDVLVKVGLMGLAGNRFNNRAQYKAVAVRVRVPGAWSKFQGRLTGRCQHPGFRTRGCTPHTELGNTVVIGRSRYVRH